MATQRVSINVAFQYETTVYVASSSGGSPTTAQTVLNPVVGAPITITNRDTGNPATVYSAATGSGTISSVTTDAGGNVNGYVVEGSYSITAGSVGAFAGATIQWEAVRGDGVRTSIPALLTLHS